MIVIDASAAVELLLWTDRGRRVADRLRSASSAHAPDLLIPECLAVIRKMVLGGASTATAGRSLANDLQRLDVELYETRYLARRAFDLHEIISAYDAMYVALAEALDAPLLTFDTRLAATSGHAASIELP